MLTLFESPKKCFMSYSIIEIEVTQPLPTLSVSEADMGIALILRRKDKPIGFLMQPLSAKSVLLPEDLAQLIAKEVGTKILQENIREELIPPIANLADFPSLTVAICTKDRPENLARCLQSLLNLQTSASKLEILVIDNAPSDERTQKLVASLPTVRYTKEPKPGLNFARNHAVKEAKGEILAFVDDDVVVDRQWLNGLKSAWAENPDAGAFTGLVLPYELDTEAQILFEKRGGFRKGFEKIAYGKTIPNDSLDLYPCGTGEFGVGCNMAFSQEVLLKIGGFDEALDTGAPLPGGGDHDIFYQVIRAGYTLVYEPQYLVFHQHRREYAKLRHQYWTWGLSLMAFAMKVYQSDPDFRDKWLRLIRWWFQHQLRQFFKSIVGRHTLPPDLILTELWGAIIGICGEYSRSLERIKKIRKQYL
jgi:glycosyltransferase involved in cell wall biosynthesis